MKKITIKNDYIKLIVDIGEILENGRKQAYKAVNNILVRTYWEIGKMIVKFEQKGKQKAEYGTYLFEKVAKDMRGKYGKGFSRTNLIYIRLLYLKYRKSQTLSDQLSWSHYVELLNISDDLARSFYEKQCIHEKCSVRELKRQKNSMLFERIALSKSKKEVLRLSSKGHIIETSKDIIKEPYILEFLGIPEDYQYSEKELEQKIIDNLQLFLLELGKGFTFVKRQFRITLSNRHYYADLVFYHRILKCFVLIDLKIGEVNHGDVGQMNMYLNYFKKEENTKGDNDPIGLILTAEKHDVTVEYALGGISNKLFVSKYQLYLPKKEELEAEIKKLLE